MRHLQCLQRAFRTRSEHAAENPQTARGRRAAAPHKPTPPPSNWVEPPTRVVRAHQCVPQQASRKRNSLRQTRAPVRPHEVTTPRLKMPLQGKFRRVATRSRKSRRWSEPRLAATHTVTLADSNKQTKHRSAGVIKANIGESPPPHPSYS